MVDVDVLVFLGVEVNLLLVLLVLEAQLVVAVALVGLALDGHPRLVPRQLVGWQLQAVIDPADGDRLVAIAFQVMNDQLLANPRDGHMAPGGAGDVLCHADPAGAVFVMLALAVPGELDLHPGVLVGVDLLVGGTDDHGVLWTVDARLGERLGAPLGVVRHQLSLVVVVGSQLRLGAFFGLAGVLLAAVDEAHRAPAAVHVLARMAGQGEGNARLQARVIAFDQGNTCIAAVAAQTVQGEGLAGFVELGPGRVVVALVAAALVIQVLAITAVLVGVVGVLEGVVALGLASGAHVLGIGKAAQRRLRLVATGCRVVLHRLVAHAAVNEQAIAVHQLVPLGTVAEGVEKAFLAHDAFDEVVVGVAGLYAVLAHLVLGGHALLVVLGKSVGLEHCLGDLRDGEGLEDPPVGTELQARQARLDHS